MTRLFPPTPPRLRWSLKHWQQKLRTPWTHSLRRFTKRRHLTGGTPPNSVESSERQVSPTPSVLTETVDHPARYRNVRSGRDDRNALIIHHLDKIFNIDHAHPCHALTDVNLTIPKGTVQMLVGPSGAGKTTLLLCLAGLLQPTHGAITLLGQCLGDLSLGQQEHFRRQHIGMVFQESNLLRSLTALENVEAMLQFRGVQGHAAHRQAQELLDAVGLHTHLDHLPRHLSGGQQQRVSVARALAGYPPIILADEPTAALDFKTGHKVVEFMHHMAKDHGCTVIITTHDTRILDVGDRTCHLHDGVIGDDVLQESSKEYRHQV